MPIEIRDLNGGLGIFFAGHGVITEKEYLDVFTKHLKQDDHKLRKYRYSFADWTAVSKAEISTKAVNFIASLCISAAVVNPDIVLASVADQDSMYGLTRMAQTLRDKTNWENEVFRNRQDAEAWIKARLKDKYGIDNPAFD
jgi:hypothetical protein